MEIMRLITGCPVGGEDCHRYVTAVFFFSAAAAVAAVRTMLVRR